jgi:hypothetical protein
MTRKLVWNVVFVLVAVGIGLSLSLKPWRVFNEQREIANRSVAEMHQAEKERARLMKTKAEVESSVGREQLVREAGYRKPGETPVDGSP